MLKKISALLLRHYQLTALICGVLSSFAFAPYYFIFLLAGGLIVCFYMADQLPAKKQSALLGYFYGFGLFGAGFSWIGNALLIEPETFGWLYPITLLAAGSFFGLFTILPFVFWKAFQKNSLWLQILVFSAAWVLLEWLRSFIFTGFPWNLLGTIWTFHPLFIQSAALWGTYGLSLITLILSGSLYALFYPNRKSFLALLVVLPAVLLVYGHLRLANYDRTSSDTIVRLVQPSISQQMKWDPQILDENIKTYIELSEDNSLPQPDFIIWGETASPFDLTNNLHYRELSLKIIPPNSYLITGLLRYDSYNDKLYNAMVVFDSKGKLIDVYDKAHLVPFGEYLPLRKYLPKILQPIASKLGDLSSGSKFKNITIDKYPAFGALICYEIIFPDEVINRDEKPQWLVVLTNDGWYGDSAGPYQHFSSAVMRAVEEGLTVVRSANNGISGIINPLGEVTGKIDLNRKSAQNFALPAQMSIPTFYNLFGSIPLIVVLIIFLCLSVFSISVKVVKF